MKKTLYVMSFPLPPPHHGIREATIIWHSEEQPTEDTARTAILTLTRWAESDHGTHPDMPEWEKKSYLAEPFKRDCSFAQMMEQLRRIGVAIRYKTVPADDSNRGIEETFGPESTWLHLGEKCA